LILPDVNVLICAFRTDSEDHAPFSFCREVLEQPNATITEPGARHWNIFQQLCEAAKAAGNLVQDAWFAALAIESGCEWITTDADYARFSGLVWRSPLWSLDPELLGTQRQLTHTLAAGSMDRVAERRQ
jgi:hypothetical protein